MHGLQKFLLFCVLTCLGEIGQGSKIIHGKKVPKDSMLYMASVQNARGHVCGGFLIAEDYVVTAAHCDDFNPTHVVLGNHNISEGNDKKIKIEKKIRHKSYENVAEGHDIMLLKLSAKGHKVEKFNLSTPEMNLDENEVCQVAGWGLTEENIQPNELRVVDVLVISRENCKAQWGNLPANVICAGGYGTEKGFCQGDSGGPLVCRCDVAFGIVSFNSERNCKYPDKPNVYTDISKYRKWIDNIIRPSE